MKHRIAILGFTALTACVAATAQPTMLGQGAASYVRPLSPGSWPTIGRVDERYLSYNVESVEVIGGNFWAPFPKEGEAVAPAAAGPHGTEFASNAYQKRDPIDLRGNARLRMLTKALGPAYMRVSGSWANSIYFQNDDLPAMSPPKGYQGVMTRSQWAGVVEFGKVVDAKILTSFAISPGAQRADGSWNSDGARQLFAYTKSIGGRIDSVELLNEPNVARTPYDPDAFGRDHAALQLVIDEMSPDTLLVGPSSTGEAGFKLFANPPAQMATSRLLSGTPAPRFDVFSHHFYGAVSSRCKSLGERNGTTVTTTRAEALTAQWLARADQAQGFYRNMRDRYAPGAPIWITEMAQTACGGDQWASTFWDSFRFIDQLGRLAQQDVSIIFHNTLAASDYALIDDRTWLPRPNYWAALLWQRHMGTTVLDAGANGDGFHIYAHCQKGRSGGVTIAAINLDETRARTIAVPSAGNIYTLTFGDPNGDTLLLNGQTLQLDNHGSLPELKAAMTKSGPVSLPAASISFIVQPDAKNSRCPTR